MQLFYDERCLSYAAKGHPERPFRVASTVERVRLEHPEWVFRQPALASDESLLRAHSQRHVARLLEARDFDADTAFHEGISEIARLSVGGAIGAMESALAGEKAFSLMRPPGHHAEREQAMGFCYLNSIAICALSALARGLRRVAVWDFDAHHGNGTEAILLGREGTLFVSAHQHPCYPGTGVRSDRNCRNYPVAPLTSAEEHMGILRSSWQELLDFRPDLVLVSAGFDAYVHDPITQMSLEKKDFGTLGRWLNESPAPVACVLEGGYSDVLSELVVAFLEGWEA